jgi:threonylcarbamoyladenosine tRNA methylthiotransferase MtaB
VITGFPGETETEFARGIDYIDKVGVNYLHVFPYSERTATSAAKRWSPLDDHTVHERARTMRSRDKSLRRRFEDRFVGSRRRVLFENTRDSASGLLKGYSENYLPVLCDGPDSFMNRLVDVEIVARKGRRLLAEAAAAPLALRA